MKEYDKAICSAIEFRTVDGITLITFKGQCTEQTLITSRAIIRAFIRSGKKVLLMDLSDLSFTREIGYLALDDYCIDMYHAGGVLILINPTPDARKEMEKMSISRGCVSVDNLEQALLTAKEKAA